MWGKIGLSEMLEILEQQKRHTDMTAMHMHVMVNLRRGKKILQSGVGFFEHFFDTAPSYEAWETHRYLKNRLGIVRARGGGLLDHPYAPHHPPFVPPTEDHLVGHLTSYCHQMSNCGLYRYSISLLLY